MKRTLSAVLALCLLAALFVPATAEDLVCGPVEAPVGEAWTAGADNGLSVDGVALTGDDFTAWTEGAEGCAVSAPDEDGVVVLGPDAEVPELDAAELPGEGAPEAIDDGEAARFDAPETPADPGSLPDLPEPDALFAGYVRRFFFGGGRRVLMATNNAGRQLSGQDRVIYSALKLAIVRIANGDLSSTVVRIPVTDVLGKLCFTASDLGVIVEYGEDRRPTQDSLSALYAAFWNQYTYHFNRILDALWCDCTYELYWFDRYNAPVPVPKRPSAIRVFDHDSGEYAVCHREGAADITISLPVLQQYAAKDSENNIVEYAIDTGVIAGAKAAAANAQTIVDRYADCSDYAKLFGYAYEICKRVTYNNAAARDTWELTDQNPWKLIWVFDGDPETNVVCEGCAMAFSYLCELSSFDSGVRCFMVSGNASGPHAWNIVRMGDGSNYLVDVTWMDGAWVDTLSGGLADWISQQKGHSLFLAGGTGSVEGGYTVQYRTGSNTTRRTYDANTLGCYAASDLALASAPYTLNGFQSIGGDTYYFDDGVYVTGNRTIDGTAYGFGESGVLAATWTVGWHTIDGVDYYFDANGLHTHHSVETLAPVPATCTDTGLTEGKRCRECSAVLVEQDVEPALGHVWGALRFTLSGDKKTMTAARTCLRDATHIQSETANTVASIAQAPTCSDMGTTTYTATFLSPDFPCQTRTFTDIPALGHDWSAPVYAWSDDNRTVTATLACKRAGCAETQSETVAVSSEVTRAATCAEAGETTYTGAEFANRAFAVQTRALENIPALGHDLAHHAARAATCTETGWSAYDACSRCDYTTYSEIPAKGHDLAHHAARAATCAEIGWSAYDTCSRCGYTTYAEIPAKGHDLAHHAARAATCTAIGWNEYDACSRCGYTTYSQIPAKGHDLVHQAARAATCTAIGWNAYDACSRCDYTTCSELAKLGHALVHHEARAATCTEAGWSAYDTCRREGCGYTTYAELPSLDHDLVHHAARAATCTEAGWNAYDTCRREGCGYTTYAELPALGHRLTAYARVDATYTAAGTEAYWACTACRKLFSDANGTTPIRQPSVIPLKTSTAANDAIAKINALPATAGSSDKAAVEAARAAYSALSEEEKALVSAEVARRLTSAESQVKAAEEKAAAEARAAEAQAAEDGRAADAVVAAIHALPDAAGTDDRAAVEAARAAYDALTDDQKQLVSADVSNRLTDAERQVRAAGEQAAEAAKIRLTKARVTAKDKTWTGKALKPKVTVKLNGKALKKGTDYTVRYKNNVRIGKATVIVKGVGKYAGTAKGSFTIKPKKVSGLSLKAGEKQLTATWKKAAGDVTGYQIEYGLTKDFKGAKKVTVKKAATAGKVLKQLKTGKTYYVRIRAYKKAGKTTYWSAWSKAVRSKKIK